MTRSAKLLKGLLAEGALPAPRIARALDCAESDLSPMALGEPVMTLEMQMRLADLLIAEVPAMARQGHSLKAQVEATMNYQSRVPVSSQREGWPKESGRR